MTVSFDIEALGGAFPMHLRLDATGTILGAGPALERVAGGRHLTGCDLLEVFSVERPMCVEQLPDLRPGERILLRFREGRPIQFRGHLVPAVGGAAAIMDLSFGLSDLADLGGAGLTAADFSPTDPTLDMLYLIEANGMAFSEVRRLVERLRCAKSRAEEQAFTDTLTGLGNRRALDRYIDCAQAGGDGFALCHVDLDYFKSVNDEHGHAAGDAVLRTISARLLRAVRAKDKVTRVGGDEFILIMPGMTDVDMIDGIACRIASILQEPISFGGHAHRVSASIGIAISSDYSRIDPDRMFADADAALYLSKSAGRATHRIANVSN